jgi:glutamine amidotransferase
MITIIDYGCGNIKAFVNVYDRLNISVSVVSHPKDLLNASHLLLPGVGSFDFVMRSFNVSEMRDAVEEMVQVKEIPVLGICAGMQILANSSEEGTEQGLGLINGKVRLFQHDTIPFITKCPHMGWNNVVHSRSELFSGIDQDERFYFVHSYYFQPETPDVTIGTTNYGIEFTSAVNRKNIFGVQFHPEKSHNAGIRLLKNFASL